MKTRCLMLIILAFLFIGCSKKVKKTNYLLKKVSSNETGIDFKNNLTEDSDHSIINYIYFYNGSGVASGDINNDGYSDLFFVSNQEENKLYLNKGNLKFEDVSKKANIKGNASWNTGATMVDINNDGYLDIYVCAVSGLLDFKGHNELFINNGDGTFSEKSKEYGLDFQGYSTQAYFFDYDKDDDLDVYIVNQAVHTILSHGPSNLRNKRTPFVGDVLLKNEKGRFINASEQANIYGGSNGYGLSAAIADYNNDGWDDIYVCNDFHEDDYYYINNHDGTFSEKLSENFSTISRFSMGSDAGDLDGNGFQDIITLDMLPKNEKIIKETEGDDAMYNMQERLKKLGYKDQFSRNMVQMNTGDNYFQETAFFNRIADSDWSWAPLIADFNNDGHQDVFITNGILRRPNDLDFKMYIASTFKNKGVETGLKWLYKSINEMPSGKVSNQIFKGNSLRLSEETGNWIEKKPSLSNGAIYIDLDLDGDLDIVVNNLNDYAGVYKNTLKNKNYLSVKLHYKGENKEGIGSKITVFSGNIKQSKQLFKSRGFLSSLDGKLHFGLDTIKNIDSIQVIWPDNSYQTEINPLINTEISVSYHKGNAIYNYVNSSQKSTIFKKVEAIDYTHKEDTYNDFNNERLIPYKVSTLGPAIAISDIDNNSFEDLFIGNSSGKKAELFLNNGTSFQKTTIPAIEKDSLCEDNAAVFFDADNDGDLDLYVASGINDLGNRSKEVNRLYINNYGIFEKAKNKIPENALNTSCVVSYDYDKDGDEDLFIGNLSDPTNYGLSVSSYLLNNDGKGNFTKDNSFKLNAMVSGAAWQDINNDGVKDLLISTEWGAPKVYLNKEGQLSLEKIPEHLNGLWQSIISFDIDKDGDKDVLLGNWGLNTKYNLSPTEPLHMYHNDFDSNGKYETVVAYNINGLYYPINSKSELGGQMNSINKKFIRHKDFALKSIEEVFSKKSIHKATKYSVDLLASGYLKNNNGVFDVFVPFTKDLQLAPINSFHLLELEKEPQLLISGNSLKVNTYHGAYTSLKGILLKSINEYNLVSKYGIEPFNEQIKKTAIIEMKDRNILLVLANDAQLKTYEFENK
jgi:enediyne biosynthesis protein E4